MSEMRFITVGYIEWRKGQDLLIDAVSRIPEEQIKDTEFILIGQNTSLMAKELIRKSSRIPNIKIPGTVSREEVHDLMDGSDLLICPSREDPMPTVCAEAMMHSVPCLVSDATGTSEYIKDGYDGLVFPSENADELKDKILWCIGHAKELKEMGERAHEIYVKHFSTQSFENDLLRYVEEMLS